MLQNFLAANHLDLVERCRQKADLRFAPLVSPPPENLVAPLLLQQIARALNADQSTSESVVSTDTPPQDEDIARAAAQHGAELLRLGYSIDQLVHDYGDVCQSISELALERKAPVTVGEFRTLNRCLDNAIADAVTSFGEGRAHRVDRDARSLHDRLTIFHSEQRRLLEIARQSFSAIQTGGVGLTGATATLLVHTLHELRALSDRTLPQLHLQSEARMTSSS
ncbi:MAG: hypothetical protein ABI905_15015 [Betaproteobacteria bacterium]